MREKKFRIWHDGELLPVIYADFVNDEVAVLPTAELETGNVDYIKGVDRMEQSTGLRDKDGVEIWEGDIVVTEVHPRAVPATIRFGWGDIENHYKYEPPHTFYGWYLDGLIGLNEELHTGNVIVIGNIHETPELIGDIANGKYFEKRC